MRGGGCNTVGKLEVISSYRAVGMEVHIAVFVSHGMSF